MYTLLATATLLLVPQVPDEGAIPFFKYGWRGWSWFGWSVAWLTDQNGDGRADYAIADTKLGTVWIVSSGELEAIACIRHEPDQTFFGDSIVPLYDVQFGGHASLAVGYELAGSTHSSGGGVAGYSLVTGKQIWCRNAPPDGGDFANAVSGIEDLDGDGVSDILVASRGIGGPGEAWVLSGVTGSTIVKSTCGAAGLYSGQSISPAGDTNQDGVPDFIVGSTAFNREEKDLSRVEVFSGRDGSLIRTVQELQGLRDFGVALAGPIEWNDDGVPDFVVGATCAPRYGSEAKAVAGLVYVISGADGSVLRVVEKQPHEGERVFGAPWFGGELALTADRDGDGTREIVVSTSDVFGMVQCYGSRSESLLMSLQSWVGENYGAENLGFSLADSIQELPELELPVLTGAVGWQGSFGRTLVVPISDPSGAFEVYRDDLFCPGEVVTDEQMAAPEGVIFLRPSKPR